MTKVKENAESNSYPILEAERWVNKRNRDSDSEEEDLHNKKIKEKVKDTKDGKEEGEVSDEEMPEDNGEESDDSGRMIVVPEIIINDGELSDSSTSTIVSD